MKKNGHGKINGWLKKNLEFGNVLEKYYCLNTQTIQCKTNVLHHAISSNDSNSEINVSAQFIEVLD